MAFEEYTEKKGALYSKKFREVPTTGISRSKKEKTEAIDNLTVTTASGKVFQADLKSLDFMKSAMSKASRSGQTSHAWKLKDNTIVPDLTLAELEEAHDLAIDAIGAIMLGA